MKARRKRRPDAVNDAIEGPAIVQADHIRDRDLSLAAGAPKGWRRTNPLVLAYDRGQLGGGDQRYTATRRIEAGQFYADLFATSQASGRDSTEFRPGGTSGPRATLLSAFQAEALRSLEVIERRLGERDRRIVRMVCGEGYFPSEAVRAVCSDYRHSVPARLREALDALIEAIEWQRRRGDSP